MNYQQFITKWVGKRYRENAQLGYQCTSLCKLYYQEVYKITGLFFGGSAINGFQGKGNLKEYFDFVPTPKQGDLVFYNITPTNPYGHVAIVDDSKNILEQNGGRGSGTGLWDDAIRLYKAPTNVAGYMRLKTVDEVDKRVQEFADLWWIEWRSKTKTYSQYDTLVILSKILK